MSNDQCLFCRIIEGREALFIHENDDFVAIHDKYPKAPVHALVIPRLHVETLNEIQGLEPELCKGMLVFAVETAAELGVKENGYRIINNVGSGGGQVIFHLHWHLLAGRPVGFDIEEEI